MKILIIKRDKIGDMLLVTPMLNHLRHSLPHARIDFLANDYNYFILRGNHDIDNLFIYQRSKHNGKFRPLAFLQELFITLKLSLKNYDFVIAAGGVYSPRAISRAIRLNGKRVIGFVLNDSQVISGLTDPVKLLPNIHEVDANYLLLQPLGILPPVKKIYPTLYIKSIWKKYAENWLREKQIENFIVIGINSRRDKRKPSNAQILSWSKTIYTLYKVKTVLLWQPGDKDNLIYPGDDLRVKNFLDEIPYYVVPHHSDRSLFQAIAIIQHAKVTLLPDGGLAHLASLSSGGVIALFADTKVSPHPNNWRPYTDHSQYLEANKTVEELSDELVLSKISDYIFRK
jgi:ADP-heptose:LPS heptosyltransferase